MAGSHDALNQWVGAHTALLIEGQSRLSEVIETKEPEWELSLNAGLITLNGHRLQFALLGSVNEDDNTWLWSWADRGLDQRAIAIRRAQPLAGFGAEYGLWEFSQDSFPMAGVIDLGLTAGASVALVAMPQLLGGAIFSGPYPGGRLYAVITDPQLTAEQPTAVTAARHIGGARGFGVTLQRDLVSVYAAAHQLPTTETDDSMALTFEDGSVLTVTFDQDNTITKMHGILPATEAHQPKPAKPADTPGDVPATDGGGG